MISFLGSQVTLVAMPFQIYQLTHSPAHVGLIGLIELGPMLGCALLGGAFADAHDRRRMVLSTEVAFTVLSTLLLLNALQPEPSLLAIYVIAAFQRHSSPSSGHPWKPCSRGSSNGTS